MWMWGSRFIRHGTRKAIALEGAQNRNHGEALEDPVYHKTLGQLCSLRKPHKLGYRDVERDKAGGHSVDCVIVRGVLWPSFVEGTYHSCIVTSDSDIAVGKTLFDKPHHCKFKSYGLSPSNIPVSTVPPCQQTPGWPALTYYKADAPWGWGINHTLGSTEWENEIHPGITKLISTIWHTPLQSEGHDSEWSHCGILIWRMRAEARWSGHLWKQRWHVVMNHVRRNIPGE